MDARRLLGKNVKRLRRRQRLSQEELAARCDLHRTYVSGVERGVRNPTLQVLAKLATALEVPISDLLESS